MAAARFGLECLPSTTEAGRWPEITYLLATPLTLSKSCVCGYDELLERQITEGIDLSLPIRVSMSVPRMINGLSLSELEMEL